ncbi:MAG: phytoene/squalene synthase family protein [Gemmatimonadaceae bacterium]
MMPRTFDDFSDRILPRVSRTFALSIRLLPGALRRAVRTAYLICRIADTVEDDGAATVDAKSALLARLLDCFDDAAAADTFGRDAHYVTGDPAHIELLRHTGDVFAAYRAMGPRTREHIRYWVTEMVHGMAKFVVRYPSGIRIETLAEYREYCYYVAGTVGHLLTDLWQDYSPHISARVQQRLRARCARFGEALQTVNILKDIAWDALHENSIYIPQQSLRAQGSGHDTLLSPDHAGRNRAAIAEFISLAAADLDAAVEYTLAIPRRALSIRLFCMLPLLFAAATLRNLSASQAMLEAGGVVKISRREVRLLMIAGSLLAGSNRSIRWLVARVRSRPLPFGSGPARVASLAGA